jgi:catechol O-methyltransferase
MIFRGAKLAVVSDILAKKDPKPKMIIEFGTFVGCSALAWGATLRDFHGSAASDIHVYTFELDAKMVQVSRDMIKLAQLDDIVTVVEGPGSESLKKLHAEGKVKGGQVDMVFIDHWEKMYLPDLQLCEELNVLRKGSIVVADNTDIPGAPVYLAYVKNGGSGKAGAVRFESISHEAVQTSGQRPGPVGVPPNASDVNETNEVCRKLSRCPRSWKPRARDDSAA